LKKLQSICEKTLLQKKNNLKSLFEKSDSNAYYIKEKLFKKQSIDNNNINAFDIEKQDFEINEIVNSLSKSGKKIQIIDIYMKIFDLIEYIPSIKYLDLIGIFVTITDLLEKVFLKFRLENKKDKISHEINELNNSIFLFFKFYLFNDLEILCVNNKLNNNKNTKLNESSNQKEISVFDFHYALTDFIISNNTDKIKNLKKYAYENFYESLNDNLCFFSILLPKSNSIFKHTLKNEVLPFFLEIKIRISNVEYSDKILMELIKNLDMILLDVNNQLEVAKKIIPLSFSNTQIHKNEFER
jgi:hypothetical protein